jgi:nucleoside-diphosphate-sugar epimerase
MKVLVTGVSGFIGSHLAERLLREGYRVTGVDSFLDYYPRSVKENNIKRLNGKKGFEFIEADLLALHLGRLLMGVEAVFHQAAIAGVRASWGGSFDEYVRNNILGTQLLLEACKDKELKKFIYASSSSVSGVADARPIKQTTPVRPVSPYGVSKLSGEQLAYLYFKGYGIPVVSLRYFTVYGPRQRPDMAFHKFLKAVMLGEEIVVYGTGKQTRDFTFITDSVEANVGAFSKGVPGEAYNIGGGSRIQLIDCIRLIEEISGKKAKLRYGESQRGDVVHTYADIGKAVRDFQYSPKVGISEGLAEHYRWLTKNLDVYLRAN